MLRTCGRVLLKNCNASPLRSALQLQYRTFQPTTLVQHKLVPPGYHSIRLLSTTETNTKVHATTVDGQGDTDKAPTAEELKVDDDGADSSAVDEVTEANDKVEKLELELGETKDHLLRALAETENVRTRSSKQVDSAREYGIQKFAKQMVEVADNLRRAIDSIPEEERLDDSPGNRHLFSLCEGVAMTSKELNKVFGAYGIVEVSSSIHHSL